MTPHLIHTEDELRLRGRLYLLFGVCLGMAIASVLLPAIDRLYPPPGGGAPTAPQILEQGPMRTVIRVPTQRGAAELACTVTIDHVRRSYAVNC